VQHRTADILQFSPLGFPQLFASLLPRKIIQISARIRNAISFVQNRDVPNAIGILFSIAMRIVARFRRISLGLFFSLSLNFATPQLRASKTGAPSQ